MRPFLLVWNVAQLEVLQPHLLGFLDSRPEIKNYYVPFIGVVLLIADQNQSPSTLSNMLHAQYPNMLLSVLPADQWSVNGWMPQVFWDLISHPRSSGRWDGPHLPSSTTPGIRTLGDLVRGLPLKK